MAELEKKDKLVFYVPRFMATGSGNRDTTVVRISNDLAALIKRIDRMTDMGTARITKAIAEFCEEHLVFEEMEVEMK